MYLIVWTIVSGYGLLHNLRLDESTNRIIDDLISLFPFYHSPEFSLDLLAPLDVGGELPLETGRLGVQVNKLDTAQLPQLTCHWSMVIIEASHWLIVKMKASHWSTVIIQASDWLTSHQCFHMRPPGEWRTCTWSWAPSGTCCPRSRLCSLPDRLQAWTIEDCPWLIWFIKSRSYNYLLFRYLLNSARVWDGV